MSEQATTTLTTRLALDAIAYERAPRQEPGSHLNRRVVCADGYKVSVQASPRHYADDSRAEGDAPYFSLDRDVEIHYPWRTFELGNPSEWWDAQIPAIAKAGEEGGGVCAFTERVLVAALLDAHGGAVAWEPVATDAGPATN